LVLQILITGNTSQNPYQQAWPEVSKGNQIKKMPGY